MTSESKQNVLHVVDQLWKLLTTNRLSKKNQRNKIAQIKVGLQYHETRVVSRQHSSPGSVTPERGQSLRSRSQGQKSWY
jgi:hypothetical protein